MSIFHFNLCRLIQLQSLARSHYFIGCKHNQVCIWASSFGILMIHTLHLRVFGRLFDCIVVKVHMEPIVKLSLHMDSPLVNPIYYCMIIDKLFHFNNTHLDIMFVIRTHPKVSNKGGWCQIVKLAIMVSKLHGHIPLQFILPLQVPHNLESILDL